MSFFEMDKEKSPEPMEIEDIQESVQAGTELEASIEALSDEEKAKIMGSESMEDFLQKASRIIERALAQSYAFDVTIDYSNSTGIENRNEETTEALTLQHTFIDTRWIRFRAVTAVDISPFFPELIMISYSSREFLEDDNSTADQTNHWDSFTRENGMNGYSDLAEVTEGVVLLWSSALPSRPEYRFTCHSQVTSACFNPFDKHIIFGGTYTGQIVVWDTRAKSTPVQKTSMSTSSHTHPIYSMMVTGSKASYK